MSICLPKYLKLALSNAFYSSLSDPLRTGIWAGRWSHTESHLLWACLLSGPPLQALDLPLGLAATGWSPSPESELWVMTKCEGTWSRPGSKGAESYRMGTLDSVLLHSALSLSSPKYSGGCYTNFSPRLGCPGCPTSAPHHLSMEDLLVLWTQQLPGLLFSLLSPSPPFLPRWVSTQASHKCVCGGAGRAMDANIWSEGVKRSPWGQTGWICCRCWLFSASNSSVYLRRWAQWIWASPCLCVYMFVCVRKLHYPTLYFEVYLFYNYMQWKINLNCLNLNSNP